jgi:Zn ribbon nucleic-acid-binding protein
MSTKRKKTSGVLCPECGSRMETIEKKSVKDGVVYSKKIIECVECGFHDIRKNKKDNISIKDWNLE